MIVLYDFTQQVALITGGSSGIGLATAQLMLSGGAKVAIVGSSREKGMAALKLLSAADDSAIFIQGDVAAADQCAAIVTTVVQKFGRIDIVVNSAGVYLEKSIEQTTEQEYQHIMDVNIKGAYFIAKYAVPHLKAVGRAAIVNVSSDAGLNGNCFCSAYCAAKGAVTLFTKALALELAPYRVRVNCVCPGDIDTPLLQQQLTAAADANLLLEQMTAMYPVGRIGRAEEAAAAICFLASDAASFITGAALPVDGGLTAC